MHVDSLSDTGAYSVSPLSSAIEAAAVPVRLPSIYELGDYSYRSRAVATNKPPLGTYRGVAAPVGVFIMERLLQDIAADTGLDFAEVQRANFLPEDVPARNAAGVTYDPGRYREAFALMLDRLGYAERRAEQDRLRQRGARELIGIGMGALVEPSAVSMDGLGLRVVTDWEDAFARLNPDGTAEVRISAASAGQAHETTFAQIAAEALHIGRDQVRVRSNGSDEGMYGSGSWGSRVTVVAGGAVSLAAQEIAAKLCAIAAHQFGVSPDEVSLTEGGAAAGDHFASLADLCTIAYFRMSELPDGMAPGLAAFSTYRPARGFTSPYGFHGCVLAVDTLTGELRIDKYVVVSDVGRVVTPALLAEPIRGGLAQGLGEPLLEEIRYGADGRQRTRSLFDYRMPRALDVPEVEIHHLQTPATREHPGRPARASEAGTIGAPAAIATALTDALMPVGFKVNALPVRFADIIRAGAQWRADCAAGPAGRPARAGRASWGRPGEAATARLHPARHRHRSPRGLVRSRGHVPGRGPGAAQRDGPGSAQACHAGRYLGDPGTRDH